MKPDYEYSPVSDDLGLRGVVVGLVRDMDELRAGKISVSDASARAALAKQIFNGVRLVLTASRFLEQSAKTVPEIAKNDDGQNA